MMTHAPLAGRGESEEKLGGDTKARPQGWARKMGLEEGSKRCGRGPSPKCTRQPRSPGGDRGARGLKSGVKDLDGDSMPTVLEGLELRGFQDGELSVLKPGWSQANPNGGSCWQG